MIIYQMSEIIPRIYLGNAQDSADIKELSLLVNCSIELPFLNHLAEKQIRIPIRDPPSDESGINTIMTALKSDLFQEIDNCARVKPVLIHCYAGAQRSAAVYAAYLMWKFNLSAIEACIYLRKNRPQVFPPYSEFIKQAGSNNEDNNLMTVNYYKVLVSYEEYLRELK